jgi:hypothetical protein
LNGETAISVRLYLPEEVGETEVAGVTPAETPSSSVKGQDSNNVSGQSASAQVPVAATSSLSMPEVIRGYVVPPRGSFRHHCNVCKQPYTQMHSFYHQVCSRIACLHLVDDANFMIFVFNIFVFIELVMSPMWRFQSAEADANRRFEWLCMCGNGR